MTTLHISKPEGRWSVKLDGVEMADKIVDGGLRINFSKYPLPPIVHMVLRADCVDLNDIAVEVLSGRECPE